MQRLLSARLANAVAAEADLANALALAGISLPGLAADRQRGWLTGTFLVDLGAAHPDAVSRLAEVVRRGAEVESAERRAAPR